MRTILLIDDDRAIRENTAEILQLAGYNVLQAEDGKKGVRIAGGNVVDLVICDIIMPHLDGYGTLKIFKKSPRLRQIPFLFLTAKSQNEDFRKGMGLGATDYITKPFKSLELLEAIELRLSAQQRETLQSFTIDNLVNSWKKTSEPLLLYPNDRFITPGRPLDGIFYLERGYVKIEIVTDIGKESILSIHQPSDIIGEFNFDNSPSWFGYDAICITHCTLFPVSQQLLKDSIQQHPETYCALLNKISSAYKGGLNHYAEMIYLSSVGKLAYILLFLCDKFNTRDIDLPRQDIAALTGLSPETVSRSIASLKQSQYITTNKGKSLHVLDKLNRDIVYNL